MTRGRQILALALAVVVAVWVVRVWLPSDRQLIERQLNSLAAAASVSGAETPVVRMTGAARVAKFFTDDVIVSANDQSSTIGGRDAVMALAAQARATSGPLKVSFDDVQIAVADPSTATAYMTVTISSADRNGSSLVDARELNVTFRKVAREWLIARVDALRTLERPK